MPFACVRALRYVHFLARRRQFITKKLFLVLVVPLRTCGYGWIINKIAASLVSEAKKNCCVHCGARKCSKSGAFGERTIYLYICEHERKFG